MGAEPEKLNKKTAKGRMILILTIILIAVGAITYWRGTTTTQLIHLFVRVSNASTRASIPHAQIRVTATDGTSLVNLGDDSGEASISIPVKGGKRALIRVTVAADGFVSQTIALSGYTGNRIEEVTLSPLETSSQAATRVNTLDVLSGEGASWGNMYELCSLPTPKDFRIVGSKFDLDAEDRRCGLYAECIESSHSDTQVCWKVRLQGRGENSSSSRRVQGKAVLTITLDRISPPAARIAGICHFYGQASQGSPAWNKDEICMVPNVDLLDKAFHQIDFSCCGGGASSAVTNGDIPAGIEVHGSGGYYWAISDVRLQGNELKIHTYCGPASAPGPGCNVDVQVIAHYQ